MDESPKAYCALDGRRVALTRAAKPEYVASWLVKTPLEKLMVWVTKSLPVTESNPYVTIPFALARPVAIIESAAVVRILRSVVIVFLPLSKLPAGNCDP